MAKKRKKSKKTGKSTKKTSRRKKSTRKKSSKKKKTSGRKKTTAKKRRKKSKKSSKKKSARKRKGGKVVGAWTKDDIKKLRKMYKNTLTADVAKELKRGEDAVKKKAARLGLKKNKTYLKKLGRGRRKK